jgi:F-type H+-transporting ATPase subunit b
MQLDWSTFILEIINFVILVWLLKHFFYKPVMNIIARRKQAIQETLDKSEKIREEAESLKSQYENRLEDWEKEKETARIKLHHEIEAERKLELQKLTKSIQQEKERADVLMQRHQASTMKKNEKLAIEQGMAFSTRLLSRLANPDLEASIIHIILEDIGNLSDEKKNELQKAGAETKEPVRVSSAYKIEKANRDAIKNILADIFKKPVEIEFKQDSSLLAGIHIDIGSWNLQASLQEELKYFANIHLSR